MSDRTLLITGGSGYFGTTLTGLALARGNRVRILDLNPPSTELGAADSHRLQFVQGDIRDRAVVAEACRGVDVVLHNVAQVPLARDRELFHSVNVGGTANVLVEARAAGVAKVVHTSSSAVFGIPETNPVTESTTPKPLEAYGRAKLEAEVLCREASASGLDVTIVRPRTILGHGRLGIMAILFEFVADGAPVYVLGSGDNRYQFVHASDLADACLRASTRTGSAVYNIGATEFGTMRETLEALVAHAATGSRVRSLPLGPARLAMRSLGGLGLVPFAPYHWMLYGESLSFDVSLARAELDWEPEHANEDMIIESYEWFLQHRDTAGGSHHQSPVKLGLLRALKRFG